MSSQTDNFCRCFWDYLVPFTKFWGIFTSVVRFVYRIKLPNKDVLVPVLCGVGVDIFVHHQIIGLYIILAASGLLFLEIAWVVTLFLKVCIHDEYSKILSCWQGILWIKDWRKTILYVAFAFGLLSKPNHLWLSSVAGIMLIILGFLHFLHVWEDKVRGYSKETLLDNQNSYLERFEGADSDNMVLIDDNDGNILNNNEDGIKSQVI